MTIFDPRNWHSSAMAAVHKTNNTDEYAFISRVRSNAVASLSSIGALGAQILVAGAKSITYSIGKVNCYKNAPTYQEWTASVEKIRYYAIALFYTIFATITSFGTSSFSRENVGHQYAQGLIDNEKVKADADTTVVYYGFLPGNVKSNKKILEQLKQFEKDAKAALAKDENTSRDYLLSLEDLLDKQDELKKISYTSIDPHLEEFEYFLSPDQRKDMNVIAQDLAKDKPSYDALSKSVATLAVNLEEKKEQGLEVVMQELRKISRASEETIKAWDDYYNEFNEHFKIILADLRQGLLTQNSHKSLQYITENIEKFKSAGQYLSKQERSFDGLWQVLDKPFWDQLLKNTQGEGNRMYDALCKEDYKFIIDLITKRWETAKELMKDPTNNQPNDIDLFEEGINNAYGPNPNDSDSGSELD